MDMTLHKMRKGLFQHNRPAGLSDHRQLPGTGTQWQQFDGELVGISERSVPTTAGQDSIKRTLNVGEALRSGNTAKLCLAPGYPRRYDELGIIGLGSLCAVKSLCEEIDESNNLKRDDRVIAQKSMRTRVSKCEHRARVEKHHALLFASLALIL